MLQAKCGSTSWQTTFSPSIINVEYKMLLQTSSVGYQPEKPDLEAYSQLCCVDEVKTILDGVVNKSCNGEAWLRKTNIVHVNIENQ